MKKHVYIWFLLAFIFLSTNISANATGSKNTWDGSVATSFAGGNGTEADPYLISNGCQLAFLTQGNHSPGKYYKLTTDIYLNDLADFAVNENGDVAGLVENAVVNPWMPGDLNGTLDGSGHSIIGLYCDRSAEGGLFKTITSSGVIQNLTLGTGYIHSALTRYQGSFAIGNRGTIVDCANLGVSVLAEHSSQAGGIVGQNSGLVINCTNSAPVISSRQSGGIVGQNTAEALILRCVNRGTLQFGSMSGGIVGYNYGTTAQCTNYGSIFGFLNAGIAGISGTTISCCNFGTVTGDSPSGLVCAVDKVIGCYNAGRLVPTENSRAAGFSAGNNPSGTISYCYTYGPIEGTGYADLENLVNGGASIVSSYYDESVYTKALRAEGKSTAYLKSQAFIDEMNAALSQVEYPYVAMFAADTDNANNGYPVLDFSQQIAPYSIAVINEVHTADGTSTSAQTLRGYSAGSPITVTARPDFGYRLDKLYVDGKELSPAESYTFQDPRGDHTVIFSYVIDENLIDCSGFASGSGTGDDPYVIETLQQFGYLSANYFGEGTFVVLANDITINEKSMFTTDSDGYISGVRDGSVQWEANIPFYGSFDGQGHTISGLYLNEHYSEHYSIGLFSGSASVKNLTLADGYVAGNTHAGSVKSTGTATNCHNRNVTVVAEYAGGITAYETGNSIMANCTNSGRIIGEYEAAGICCDIRNVQNCINTGPVTATADYGSAGGIVAYIFDSAQLYNCINDGNISSPGNNGTAGGIGGHVAGQIFNCYNTGSVLGGKYAAGIAAVSGDRTNTFCNCFSTGEISGTGQVSGISCDTGSSSSQNCYYTAELTDGTGEKVSLERLNSAEILSKFNLCVQKLNDPSLHYWTAGTSGYPVFSENRNLFTVSVTYPAGGTVDPCMQLCLCEGSDIHFTFTPDDGNTVFDVLVDGNSTGAADSYTISDLAANHTLTVVFAKDGTPISAFSSGNGSKDSPYVITSAEELRFMQAAVAAGTDFDGYWFRLSNDIVLNPRESFVFSGDSVSSAGSAVGWTPIGIDWVRPFNGHLDGTGYSIHGLYCSGGMDYQGLFGYLGKNAVISNLQFGYGYIKASSGYAGGLAGYSAGVVRNCINNGTIIQTSETCSGGLVGDNVGTITGCINHAAVRGFGGIAGNNSGTISDCSNDAAITGDFVGGIVGENTGSISFCSNAGPVKSTGFYGSAGGICGSSNNRNELFSQIKYCRNSASVLGQYGAGGICGHSEDTVLSHCTNTGDVHSVQSYSGGICGFHIIYGYFDQNLPTGIQFCTNSGTVSGDNVTASGGIAGSAKCTVDHCYNYGPVTADTFTGGIAGITEGSIHNCGNFGDVSNSNTFSGGICGQSISYNSSRKIVNCFNTADVSAAGCAGGIVGKLGNESSGQTGCVYNCYSVGTVTGDDITTCGSAIGVVSYQSIVKNIYCLQGDLPGVGFFDDGVGSVTEMSLDDMNTAEFLITLNDALPEHPDRQLEQWVPSSDTGLPVLGSISEVINEDGIRLRAAASRRADELLLEISTEGAECESYCIAAMYSTSGNLLEVCIMPIQPAASVSITMGLPAENTVYWKVFLTNKNHLPIIQSLTGR